MLKAGVQQVAVGQRHDLAALDDGPAGCNPKLDFLDTLKAVADRAKLRKGNFWLHKFRATFATWSLWAGVDLRTVQQWLGHSDMESTMRYLKPSRSQQVRQKVNEIFA
jgi:site-specific recombinase XerD